MFDIMNTNTQLIWIIISILIIFSVILMLIIINVALKSHKQSIVSGQEALPGSEGVVLEVENEKLTVCVLGEIWNATSIPSFKFKPNDKIKVMHIRGLTLIVEPLEHRQRKNF